MNRLFVSLADFDQVLRQFLGLWIPMLQIGSKVTPLPTQAVRILVERLEEFENFTKLLF